MVRIIICCDGARDTGKPLKCCHIVCAGEESGPIKPRHGDFVIAADGGLLHLKKLGVKPDLAIGDFDSLGHVPESCEAIKLSAEKDDTDTMAAVREGMKRGYSMFCLHCGMGGRLDHTLANIQTLAFILRSGGEGLLLGKSAGAVMVDGAVGFSEGMKGYVSIFSYTERAYGVCMEGLKYNLTGAVLSSSFPLGVSNEFVGAESRVSVRSGVLLAVYETCAG